MTLPLLSHVGRAGTWGFFPSCDLQFWAVREERVPGAGGVGGGEMGREEKQIRHHPAAPADAAGLYAAYPPERLLCLSAYRGKINTKITHTDGFLI